MQSYINSFPGTKTIVHTTSASAALHLVSEGIGSSILPRYVVEYYGLHEDTRLRVSPYRASTPASWNWVLIWRQSRVLSPTDSTFIREVIAASRGLAHKHDIVSAATATSPDHGPVASQLSDVSLEFGT
jgi:DNA-binding transcriptional LysR family regulator